MDNLAFILVFSGPTEETFNRRQHSLIAIESLHDLEGIDREKVCAVAANVRQAHATGDGLYGDVDDWGGTEKHINWSDPKSSATLIRS